MKSLIYKINDEIKKKVSELNYDTSLAKLKVSDRKELCDYQLNSCFKIAKILNENPEVVANNIINAIKDISVDGIKAFSDVSFCKPMFINIKFSNEILLNYVNNIYKDKNLGIDNIYNDEEAIVLNDNIKNIKSILLDYGGANIAKPLHVGHLRVAVIGEAMKRLYNRLGINTISDVHLGDYGLPMGLVIEELKDEGIVDNFTIKDLERVYPVASSRMKGDKNKGIEPDEEFSKRAHDATKSLQEDKEPYLSIWKKILDISIKDLKERYKELNVEFDYYFGESTVKDIMKPMVDKFVKEKIAYESNGAYVIDVAELTDKKEVPPCIIQKSDGAVLYATSDIATIMYREEHFKADSYVYVVDKRQSMHLMQCFRASKKAKVVDENKLFHHIEVGTVNGADGTPLKTRDGGVYKLEDLINDARKLAYDTLSSSDKINGIMSEEEINETSNILAIASVKYGDLSNSPTRDYVFKLEKFCEFQGNTGPYILYTMVRIKSIFEKLNLNIDEVVLDESIIKDIKLDNLIKDILLIIIRYKETLINAYLEYDPSILCKYIYELSNAFNSFYHEYNVSKEEDENTKKLYLFILSSIYKVIKDILNILSIDIPKAM